MSNEPRTLSEAILYFADPDVALKTSLPLIQRLDVGAFVVEDAHACHEHEWEAGRGLAGDRLVIPGVVSHATDLIEPLELVAMRIEQFAGVVGKERVIAGTDCGTGYRVHPHIAWAKLRTLVEGARFAGAELW